MDVQPAHAQPRAALDAADQLGGRRRRQPELRALVAGEHVRVRVGGDTRDDAHEHVLRAAGGDRRLEPVDVVRVVDDDQARARARPPCAISSSLLALPCRTSERRVDARLQRGRRSRRRRPRRGRAPPRTITRWTAVQGNAFEAKTTRDRGHRAASPSTYSRARARSAASATTSTGVPNSAASASARQPPRTSMPSASRALPGGQQRQQVVHARTLTVEQSTAWTTARRRARRFGEPQVASRRAMPEHRGRTSRHKEEHIDGRARRPR